MFDVALIKKAWVKLIILNLTLIFIDIIFRYENGILQQGHGLSNNLIILFLIFLFLIFSGNLLLSIKDSENTFKLLVYFSTFIINLTFGVFISWLIWAFYILFSGVVVF